ncbi:twin-arginine translocase subunit TatC, partial [Candidatus Enterovibrio escicola]
PLVARLPEGTSMIATDVASPFFTPIKLTLVISVLIVVPVVLYQLWAFIAPGLYKHEKRLVIPLLISSSLLFYFGVSFAYFVVFPLVFYFFTSIAPVDVKIATDIASYLDFILSLFMAFGIAFEIPVCIILLVWRGLVTPDDLRIKRPYIVVVAFVVGMLLTPPDLFSQMLLAIPMCLLFEVGLFFSRFYKPCEKYDQK